MDDDIVDVPETEIDNEVSAEVTHVIDTPAETEVIVDISPPADEPVITEVETEADPLPDNEIEEVAPDATINAEEPVVVASDVTPNTEATKEVTAEVKRTPDTRPKRRLGWRAYILGGSGGTK